MEVDWLLHHGRIYTVDEAFQVAEAIAWKDGHIVAVGSNTELQHRYHPKQQWNLEGRAVYPGFIDAHAHLSRYGRSQYEGNLRDCQHAGEMVARMQDLALHQPDGWLIGRGWDQTQWPDGAFPNRQLLDKAFPDRPVLLERIDIHACVVNSLALHMAGITADTQVDGGEIRMEQGQPSGLLIDKAQQLVWGLVPKPKVLDQQRFLNRAAEDCLSVGLTSVGDALLDMSTLHQISLLQSQDQFPLRVYGMMPADERHLQTFLSQGPRRDPWLHLGAFKLFADGALGSRGAWLDQPYTDAPLQSGLPLLPWAETLAIAQQVYQAGFQLNTHAIGDAATRMVLDLYQAVVDPHTDHRWRIEHAQLVQPEDLPRFGQLGVIPSIQPTHTTSDCRWIAQRIGPHRLPWAYRQRSLLAGTGLLALGSDFPVEPINPIYGFHAAVSRQSRDGYPEAGFQMEEAISRMEALRGMTTWAAYAQREERIKGQLKPGFLADLVISDQDLMIIPVKDLPNVQIEVVILGGNLRHQREMH